MNQRLTALALGLFLAASPALSAPTRTLSVMGEAYEQVVPDEAVIGLQIMSQSSDLDDAKRQQDAKLEKLFAITDALKLERKQLKTDSVQLNPEYDYIDGKQVFKGYQGVMSLSITLADIAKVGEVMQKLVAGGFDHLYGVRYQVKDPHLVQAKLLDEAYGNAKAKAEQMAKYAKQTLGAPLKIAEKEADSERPTPYLRAQAMDMEASSKAAPNPPAGEQELSAAVSVTFELLP